MGSPIIRGSATGGAPSPFDFAEARGCFRRETEKFFFPAVDYVSDDHRAYLAPEHLPPLAPQAPEATGPSRPPGSSRLDKLYESDFRRLEDRLESLKTQQIHVPSSVTQGYVPALDVRDVKAEGGVVYGSVLVEREAGVRK